MLNISKNKRPGFPLSKNKSNSYLIYFDLKDSLGEPGRLLIRPLKLYDYRSLFFN